MAYVYRHIRLDTILPFYMGIGSDSNYKRAHSRHNRNKHWLNIVNKTGYEVQIVIDNLTKEEACEKEQEFIKLYRKHCEGGLLTNITDGGEGLTGPSRETRLKISQSKLGVKNPQFGKQKNATWYLAMEQLKGKGNPNYGKPISDEQKVILRNAQLGRIKSESEKLKISIGNTGKKMSVHNKDQISKAKSKAVIDIHTNIIYDSLTKASCAVGINRTTLNAQLVGQNKNKTNLRYL